MSRDYRRIGLIAVRYLLGIVFLVSGIGKLIDSHSAQNLVELMAREFYSLIEYKYAIVLSISICELLIAVFLFWGKLLKSALSVAFVLLGLFIVVLGYFYIQGQTVESCGCFGAFGLDTGLGVTLIRDLVLLALVVAGFILNIPPPKTEPALETESEDL